MAVPSFYLKKSLRALNSLIKDVEDGQYIPPKFRSEMFTLELRLDYVAYLCRERARLEKLIQVSDAPARPAV